MDRLHAALDWLTCVDRLDRVIGWTLRRWRRFFLLILLLPYACGLITGKLL